MVQEIVLNAASHKHSSGDSGFIYVRFLSPHIRMMWKMRKVGRKY